MLWDIIRDFFVINIFGGMTSTDVYYSGRVGFVASQDLDSVSFINTDFYIPFFGFADEEATFEIKYIMMGDYLSTTFTIITFVILFIVACLFVRWCFRVFKGAFKW